jgi:hypothetical protein
VEVFKSNKGVRTNDQQTCVNVIAEDDYNIIISDGLINIQNLWFQSLKLTTTMMEDKFILIYHMIYYQQFSR